jgi:hypothetical protein
MVGGAIRGLVITGKKPTKTGYIIINWVGFSFVCSKIILYGYGLIS